MKKQINDLLLKMQSCENDIGQTANKLMDLFDLKDLPDQDPKLLVNLTHNISEIKSFDSAKVKIYPFAKWIDKHKRWLNKSKNTKYKRFGFFETEITDFCIYCIIDKFENKVICHLNYDNQPEYNKELGNRIANLLNESQS